MEQSAKPKALATVEQGSELQSQPAALPVATSIEGLLLAAVEQGATVEQLERLMALRQTIQAEQAKQAFDGAMSRFQADCPSIVKDKVVKDKYDKERYRYAPLESIVRQVKDLIAANGLSYKLEAEVIKAQLATELSWVKSTCIVKHESGHEEVSFFEVPVDTDAYMSAPQKFASALTFAKRYAFCNAFGIMTAEDDTDAAEHSGGAADFSEPAGGAADGIDPDFREGTGLYLLEGVLFADNGKGVFAKFMLRSQRDTLTTSIFQGWQDACKDVQVPTNSARDKMRVNVNKRVEVRLERQGKYLNIMGLRLVETAAETSAAEEKLTAPDKYKGGYRDDVPGASKQKLQDAPPQSPDAKEVVLLVRSVKGNPQANRTEFVCDDCVAFVAGEAKKLAALACPFELPALVEPIKGVKVGTGKNALQAVKVLRIGAPNTDPYNVGDLGPPLDMDNPLDSAAKGTGDEKS